MKVTCKCHGVSGSCSLITCWQQLAPFRKVGDHLQDKYGDATRVKTTRSGRLRVRRKASNIPTANDLVFLHRSPNYCHVNDTIGSLGMYSPSLCYYFYRENYQVDLNLPPFSTSSIFMKTTNVYLNFDFDLPLFGMIKRIVQILLLHVMESFNIAC